MKKGKFNSTSCCEISEHGIKENNAGSNITDMDIAVGRFRF